MMNCKSVLLLGAGLMLSGNVLAQLPPGAKPPPSSGAEIERMQRAIEREQRGTELLDESRRIDKEEKDKAQPRASDKPQLPDTQLFLKKVEFTRSQVLAEEDLSAIVGKYLNRLVSIADLYQIVTEVNELYRQRGYVTAMAVLPEQEIQDGIVKIILIEGRVGEVPIEGNATTKESYIRKRMKIPQGVVLDVNTLDRELQWFNGTNDVKLTIQLQAGSQPGTTDYKIVAHEPAHHQFTLFSDTAGSNSTGEWRGGVSYLNSSVFGVRDAFSAVAITSKSSRSALLNYSIPINSYGTRIAANYNYNWLKVTENDLNDFNIKGKAHYFGATLTHPYIVQTRLKAEAQLSVQHQMSKTTILGATFVDDKVTQFSINTSLTRYFPGQVLYARPSYTYARYDGLGDDFNYSKLNLDAMWQMQTQKGHIFSANLSAQKAFGNDYLPSGDQFYLGGFYSVRGYKENVISGEDGALLNLEGRFALFSQRVYALLFADIGKVSGDSVLSTDTLSSAGVGAVWPFWRSAELTLIVGHPFKKKINDEDVNSVRVHFGVNARF